MGDKLANELCGQLEIPDEDSQQQQQQQQQSTSLDFQSRMSGGQIGNRKEPVGGIDIVLLSPLATLRFNTCSPSFFQCNVTRSDQGHERGILENIGYYCYDGWVIMHCLPR